MTSNPNYEFEEAYSDRKRKQDARDAALSVTRELSLFTTRYSDFASRAQLKTLDAAAETLREIRKGITYSE